MVLIWDVYKVHREKKTRNWIKENYAWVLLHFVAAGTTSVVELRLRLEADSCVIEGAVRKFKCQIWN